MFTFKFMELGWERARNRMRLVFKACHIFAHSRHKLASASCIRCYKCRGDPTFLMTEVERLINQVASRQTEIVITKKKLEKKWTSLPALTVQTPPSWLKNCPGYPVLD